MGFAQLVIIYYSVLGPATMEIFLKLVKRGYPDQNILTMS